MEEIPDKLEKAYRPYAGTVGNIGGVTRSGGDYEFVTLRFANPIDLEDARATVDLVLDKVAEARGLQADRAHIEVTYEDEEKETHPL